MHRLQEVPILVQGGEGRWHRQDYPGVWADDQQLTSKEPPREEARKPAHWVEEMNAGAHKLNCLTEWFKVFSMRDGMIYKEYLMN